MRAALPYKNLPFSVAFPTSILLTPCFVIENHVNSYNILCDKVWQFYLRSLKLVLIVFKVSICFNNLFV
jgi:hypothetical protein